VALAGQSFGAFLSLSAAEASEEVHAVIRAAPAAYGSFSEFYESGATTRSPLSPPRLAGDDVGTLRRHR
jgi:hypothetical protein